MRVVFFDRPPRGIVSGDRVTASALALVQGGGGRSGALDLHGCREAGDYIVSGYECAEHGARVRIVVCPDCDAPIAAVVLSECEHVAALLDDVASGVFAL